MNKITRIGISGVGPFKKGASLPIVPGVSVLYGRNDTAGGNANAVGKSLIGKIIQSVFYEPAVRADKKQGRRFVSFSKTSTSGGGKNTKVDDVKVTLTSGRQEELVVEVNGKDKSARKKTETKALALKTWGLSEEEFATYGIVDASIPHALVKGSSAARKEFFTSFFGLDRMDAEKKVFTRELAEIKKVKAAHSEVATAYSAARQDTLSKEERTSLEQEIGELEIKTRKLVRRQEQANAAQRVEAFLQVAASQIKALKQVKPRDVETVTQELKEAKAGEAQLEEYEDYLRARKLYKERTAGLDMDTSMEDLRRDVKTYTELENRLEYLEGVDKPVLKAKKVAKPDTDLAESEALVRQLRHSLTHSKKFAKGVCETCGQSVKAQDPAKVRKKLAAAEAEVEAWATYSEWEALSREHNKKLEAYSKAQAEIEDVKARLKKLKPSVKTYEKRRALVVPEKVDKPSNVYDIKALKEEMELAKFAEQNEDMLNAVKSFSPVDFDHSKLTKLQETLYAKRARLDLHNAVKKRVLDLKSRMSELEALASKQEQLELILEAYADKAMKRMAIESISHHLMASVNKYAALVFDSYSFEFVWGTQIQILVHRPEGTSDVRMLSGAESLLFTIILILSLLVFVPSYKRLNLLVLDEPTASFSEATQALFVKLLPHIVSIIPSVLIITPKTDFLVEGASQFTVVKTATGSVIKKGHANEIE